MNKGVIVLGHGSKREQANDEIRSLGSMLAASDGQASYLTAFLSNAEPDLESAIITMSYQGINNIVVMPVFLTTGNHVTQDIPEILDEVKQAHPHLKIIMAEHLGINAGLVGIIQEKIGRAAAGLQGV